MGVRRRLGRVGVVVVAQVLLQRKEILDFMDPAGELKIGDVSPRDVPGRRTIVLDATILLHVNIAGANHWLDVPSVNSDGECDGCR